MINYAKTSLLLIVITSVSQPAAAETQWLTSQDLEAFFRGNTVETVYIFGGKPSSPYYAPNGKLYVAGQNSGRIGIYADWSIDNQNRICTKSLRTNMCVSVSFDGNQYKGWTNYEGQFQPVFIMKPIKGDINNLVQRQAVDSLPQVVFVGPNGKPLPGQRHLKGQEAVDAVKKGVRALGNMMQADEDFRSACIKAGGHYYGFGGTTCYKRY